MSDGNTPAPVAFNLNGSPSEYGEAQGRTPTEQYQELKKAFLCERDDWLFYDNGTHEAMDSAEAALDAFVLAALSATPAPTEGER